jgi:glutamate dehydrogenase (NAD(P)+)
VPGVVTGKPIVLGGSLGRTSATGDGVAIATMAALKSRGIDPQNARVSIQGFGKVGYWTAVALEEFGLKIVAVSDVHGAVTGFKSVAELWNHYKEHGNLNAPGTEQLTNEELISLDVDVFIPAALADAITDENASKIKSKIVVEGANAPTTSGGDRILNDMGVLVVPDILANAGGVVVSYFEWVQDNQNYFWSADEVKSNLSEIMTRAIVDVESMSAEKKVTWRDAALMIGVDRVAEAHRLRGLYP